MRKKKPRKARKSLPARKSLNSKRTPSHSRPKVNPLRGGSLVRAGARKKPKAKKAPLRTPARAHRRPQVRAPQARSKPPRRGRQLAPLQGVRTRKESRELGMAKRLEAVAADQRFLTRLKLGKKAPKKVQVKMKAELKTLVESARGVAKALKLKKDDVRGYAYDDGRIIARMRIPLPQGVGARETLQDLQHRLSKECPACDGEGHVRGHPEKRCPKCKGVGLVSSLPEGVFMEGNFLLNTEHMMRKGFERRKNSYLQFRGMTRIQFWGTQNLATAGEGMKKTLSTLHDYGFKQPEAIYLRLGKTSEEILERYTAATTIAGGRRMSKEERRKKGLVDPAQPFQRFAPPVGGTIVRKRKAVLPKSPAGRLKGSRGRAKKGK